jgi:hypothetical protein
MLFVSATSFFKFVDPQFDSGGDFSRTLTFALFNPIAFGLFRLLISVFDNSDPGFHDLSHSTELKRTNHLPIDLFAREADKSAFYTGPHVSHHSL